MAKRKTTPRKRKTVHKSKPHKKMARKKKHKKHRRRSRRVHGIGGDKFNIVEPLLAAAGGAGSALLNKVIPASVNPNIASAGKIALGMFAPMFFKDQKTKKMVAAAGHGMIAVGTVELMQHKGMVSGYAGEVEEMKDGDFALEVNEERLGYSEVDEDDYMNDNVLNDNVLNDDMSVINDDLDVVNDDMDLM